VSGEEDVAAFKWVAMQLLEQYDSVQLLAAAMKLLTGDKKDVNIELTPEDPIRGKKRKFDGNRSGSGGYRGGSSSGGYRGGSGGSGGGQGSWRQGQGRSGDSRGTGSGYGGGQRKPYSGSSNSNRGGEGYRGGRTERRDEPRAGRSHSEDYVNI